MGKDASGFTNHYKRPHLNMDAKVMMWFINSRIMSSMNDSNVSKLKHAHIITPGAFMPDNYWVDVELPPPEKAFDITIMTPLQTNRIASLTIEQRQTRIEQSIQ
ncbi:hypothetical protein HAX54_036318 [Datura stramonium]|uniref:Uncharacterized protein n=1 Tax=Datura stramonium TaxID=4076 RepID=A0ABS8SFZ7_DATST|nr:hypothetical protein [Datura stramonium]